MHTPEEELAKHNYENLTSMFRGDWKRLSPELKVFWIQWATNELKKTPVRVVKEEEKVVQRKGEHVCFLCAVRGEPPLFHREGCPAAER